MRILYYSRGGKERQEVSQALSGVRGFVDSEVLETDDVRVDVTLGALVAKRSVIKYGKHDSELNRKLAHHESRVAYSDGVNLGLIIQQQKEDPIIELHKNGSWAQSYFQSFLYRETLKEAKEQSWKNNDQLLKGLSGKVFEDLAYGLLSQANDETHVLLSPFRTNDLMQQFFPRAKRKRGEFGHDGLFTEKGGISIPDGLLFELKNQQQPKIIAEVEYKLSPGLKTICHKYDNFLHRKSQLSDFYSKDSRFLVVTPSDSGSESYDFELENGRSDMKIFASPVSRLDVGEIVTGINVQVLNSKLR